LYTLTEKPANIKKIGGSFYQLIDEPFLSHLGIGREDSEENINEKVFKATGIGAHGKFVYTYNKPQQAEFKRKHCRKCYHLKTECTCER